MASGLCSTHCSEATVEIKIKTLDSETYTLRVDRCVPVPELKEQIATITGVLSEQQRLICRGRVLKDDQLLSAYHVEDGHTLHLVVRQPMPPSIDNLPFDPETDTTTNASRSHGSQVGSSVYLGTFNASEHGDGVFSSFSQMISAALSSIGIGNGSEVVNLMELSNSGLGNSTVQQQPSQPPVVPDSLETFPPYLIQLRHEFGSNGGNGNNSSYGSTVQNSDTIFPSVGRESGLARLTFLAEVLSSTRQLFIGQVANCLSQIAAQLRDQANCTDQAIRASIQTNSLRTGAHLQNLGALLLELGRTTMMLRLGQSPADASVNAGPPVFISASGPNPIMVQPFPFQTGTSFGTHPTGTAEVQRNINVRIRTGSFMSPANGYGSASERSQPSTTTGEINPAVSGVPNSVHQAIAPSSVNAPSIRVSEVRIVPLRTVIAAVPPPIRQSNLESTPSSTDLFYPVLARMQRGDSDVPDSTTDSQLPTEGDFRIPVNIGDVPDSTSHEVATIAQESDLTPTVGGEGAFLSNVLRQIMPLISQNVTSGNEDAASGRDSNPNVERSSRAWPNDPSSTHPSKRQKRE